MSPPAGAATLVSVSQRLAETENRMLTLTRDGVALAYEEAGIGSPPMLLVHGFAGDHTHLAPLFEYFRRSRRVVAVDRRGHGASDKPEQDYTVGLFAGDLAYLCRELGLYKPVVVVHSMDAIGFDLVARYPDLASALVLIDTPTFPPPPLVEAFTGAVAGLKSPAYRDVLRAFADTVFAPTDDAARKARIVDGMLALPHHVIASSWEQYVAFDPAPAIAACRVPLLHISSWFPADVERLREVCPQLQTARCIGAGHFAQLEVPDQVNAMIDRFLAVTTAREPIAA
jgi:pimeloyl-ACP methyl ester carboxylesterase